MSQKKAEQGNADAQYNLALKYRKGEGVPQNDKIAVKWYKEAAEQEIAEAQNNLSYMYEYGNGVLTDYVRTYMWYNLGAYNGNKLGADNKSNISKIMTSSDISKAQEMSSYKILLRS